MEKQQQKPIKKMMEFIPQDLDIDFAGIFPWACGISAILVLISWYFVFGKGLNYGVDFRGGAEVQVKFQQTVNLQELREVLTAGGFKNASVQSIGAPGENEYLVKVSMEESDLNKVASEIAATLSQKFSKNGAEVRRTDIVGPKAGAELRNSGLKAMVYAILAITIYLGLRFDFKYAPGAIVALIHDVSITAGVFGILGTEFSLQAVAALLAIIGYSVNDTVVVYDRVRELEGAHPHLAFRALINKAINETLSRTIITSGTVFIVSLAMFIWGGPAIKEFFLAMVVGTILGAYSTIYVATPLTLLFDKKKDNKTPPVAPSVSSTP